MKKISKLIALIAMLALTLACVTALAAKKWGQSNRKVENYNAWVEWVHDGDTITVFRPDKKEKNKIRFYAIDAPELAQTGGEDSKDYLRRLIPVKTVVRVEVQNIDRYGRQVATVYRSGKNINQLMIAGGHAWHYKQYDKHFYEIYDMEERLARTKRIGLWQNPNPKAPWQWRKEKREKSSSY